MGKETAPYLVVNNLCKHYGEGEARTVVLRDITTSVNKGEICVLLGPSGSGKSTFLNLIGGLEGADSGTVTVGDTELTSLSPRQLGEYRRDALGFVFQFYNLVPSLTALENVELASQICPDSLDAAETLRRVGLGQRLNNFPAQLSGGEQQRVAIARALAKNPKLLLCDEPTGALDYKTGKQILQLLQDTCRNERITALIITHNAALAPMADRVIRVNSGRVTSVQLNPNPTPIANIEW